MVVLEVMVLVMVTLEMVVLAVGVETVGGRVGGIVLEVNSR